MEDNKTYEQYRNDYNTIVTKEKQQQQYIIDLYNECNKSNYNIDKINILLKLVDINMPIQSDKCSINGDYVINAAASSGHTKLVKHLINNGANINHIDDFNILQKSLSSPKKYNKLIIYLTECGIKFDSCHWYINGAAEHNNIEILKCFITYASKSSLNREGDNRNTALHFATIYNNLEMVKILLAYNVNINARNGNNKTPLYIAAKNNNIEIVKELIKYGADVNLTCPYSSVHKESHNSHI